MTFHDFICSACNGNNKGLLLGSSFDTRDYAFDEPEVLCKWYWTVTKCVECRVAVWRSLVLQRIRSDIKVNVLIDLWIVCKAIEQTCSRCDCASSMVSIQLSQIL